MAQQVIEIENLVKRYKELVALDHLNLTVEEGEIFGLLGPNGSGKTTAIGCILALLQFDKGSVKVFGQEMEPDSYQIKQQIGVVLQNVAVFEALTVWENIDYFCGLYVKEKAVRRQYVEEAIQFAGLEEFRKFYPKKLSGGLLRRLNIACGIAHKPKLIILDEPTVAVDPQSRNRILEGIRKLNREGATIIYTSHYMEEVEQLCTRIAILDRGRCVASGTKEQLKSMIKMGEKIFIEMPELSGERMEEMKRLPHVYQAGYQEGRLCIQCNGGKHNLVHILDYLQQQALEFGRIYTELPTLNDVFLEITGKELRDSVEG